MWARTQRAYVEDLERTHRTDDMAALNGATQAVVASLQGKIECVENEFRDYRVMQDTKFQALIDSNERLTQAILRLTNPVDHHGGGNGGPPPPPPPPRGCRNNQPVARDDADVDNAAETIDDPMEEEEKEDDAPARGSNQRAPLRG